MTMNRWLVLLLIFSIALNLAVVGTFVFFKSRMDKRRPDDGRARFEQQMRRMRGMMDIDSTVNDENRAQIRQLRMNYIAQANTLRSEISWYQDQLTALLLAEPVNKDSVDVMVKRIAERHMQIESLTVRHLIAIKPLIPPEKWQRFIESRGRLGPRPDLPADWRERGFKRRPPEPMPEP